jgi:hypothetical protein
MDAIVLKGSLKYPLNVIRPIPTHPSSAPEPMRSRVFPNDHIPSVDTTTRRIKINDKPGLSTPVTATTATYEASRNGNIVSKNNLIAKESKQQSPNELLMDSIRSVSAVVSQMTQQTNDSLIQEHGCALIAHLHLHDQQVRMIESVLTSMRLHLASKNLCRAGLYAVHQMARQSELRQLIGDCEGIQIILKVSKFFR